MQPVDAFRCLRDFLTAAERRLYFRDQTPASVQALHDLAHAFRPTLIVELGTHTGLSLRVWLAAAPQAAVKAVDLSFDALRKYAEIFPLDWSRIETMQTDILNLDFPTLWKREDRVLLFVDAHDTPEAPIMEHVLRNAVPCLPEGSLIVVDEVWYSPENVNEENARDIFRARVLPEIDELQLFDACYAPYHAGGTFWGFPEVVPLLNRINRHGAELRFTPEAKHVAFYTGQQASSDKVFDEKLFTARCGVAHYHPLAGTIGGSRLADRVMPKILKLYAEGDFAAALNFLTDLRAKAPESRGVAYALAVVLARTGEIALAERALQAETAGPAAHPNSVRLLEDIRKTFFRHRVPAATRRPGVTLFAVPKPFRGLEKIIQRNAVRSWLKLEPKPEVILMGDDEGVAGICEEFGLRHVPDIRCNEWGTPLLDDIFLKAQELADTEVLCYVNADIMLFDIVQAAAQALKKFDAFLLVGHRLNYDVTTEPDFSHPDRTATFIKEALENSIMYAPTAMDYFAFTPGLWENIPPFALGRMVWDTWLLNDNLRARRPVIDCTGFVTAIHQNHGYGHIPSGFGVAGCCDGRDPEAQRNKLLAGDILYGNSVRSARFVMHKTGYITSRQLHNVPG
jgi:SAM-dependent methyltransferase